MVVVKSTKDVMEYSIRSIKMKEEDMAYEADLGWVVQ
jgi:hypothetical protein